ncbi:hypothetical protein GQF03_12350 [Sneathiella chungangensis]|uniref:Secreted protein n=1 Tax=Sneathiella chungangensis TaxID=1418234 RepID=A0A845MGJ2_9PROT|nr:hypothetical protein [Sneathiella chungangensis]MZR23118.1 hypothetical protein [Sneathiella chungangensis]
MKQIILVSMVTILVGLAQPALADEKNENPDGMAMEGITKLMDALGAFIASIPQYEAPVLNENGDIIIRRKNPEKKQEDPKLEETST